MSSAARWASGAVTSGSRAPRMTRAGACTTWASAARSAWAPGAVASRQREAGAASGREQRQTEDAARVRGGVAQGDGGGDAVGGEHTARNTQAVEPAGERLDEGGHGVRVLGRGGLGGGAKAGPVQREDAALGG